MDVSKSPRSKSSAGQRLQRLAARHAVLRTKDVSAMGIHTSELTRMVRRGTLERIGPGRYRLPAAGRGGEHQDLIVAVNAVPTAAVCLLSALQFHGIGTQLPHQIWLAVPRGTRVPRLAKPPSSKRSGEILTIRSDGLARRGTRVPRGTASPIWWGSWVPIPWNCSADRRHTAARGTAFTATIRS